MSAASVLGTPVPASVCKAPTPHGCRRLEPDPNGATPGLLTYTLVAPELAETGSGFNEVFYGA